jgi:tRNA 2-thiouridine synthesizing protein A
MSSRLFTVSGRAALPGYPCKRRKKMSEVNLKEIKADQTLDAMGLGCPMPLLKTKKVFDTLQTGQVLEVVGTDPGSKNDFPSWAERTGNEYLGCIEEEGKEVYKFYLKKS